jgi:hypothetical protein
VASEESICLLPASRPTRRLTETLLAVRLIHAIFAMVTRNRGPKWSRCDTKPQVQASLVLGEER